MKNTLNPQSSRASLRSFGSDSSYVFPNSHSDMPQAANATRSPHVSSTRVSTNRDDGPFVKIATDPPVVLSTFGTPTMSKEDVLGGGSVRPPSLYDDSDAVQVSRQEVPKARVPRYAKLEETSVGGGSRGGLFGLGPDDYPGGQGGEGLMAASDAGSNMSVGKEDEGFLLLSRINPYSESEEDPNERVSRRRRRGRSRERLKNATSPPTAIPWVPTRGELKRYMEKVKGMKGNVSNASLSSLARSSVQSANSGMNKALKMINKSTGSFTWSPLSTSEKRKERKLRKGSESMGMDDEVLVQADDDELDEEDSKRHARRSSY